MATCKSKIFRDCRLGNPLRARSRLRDFFVRQKELFTEWLRAAHLGNAVPFLVFYHVAVPANLLNSLFSCSPLELPIRESR